MSSRPRGLSASLNRFQIYLHVQLLTMAKVVRCSYLSRSQDDRSTSTRLHATRWGTAMNRISAVSSPRMHRHLHVAVPLASTTALGCPSHVQQGPQASPIIYSHPDTRSQWRSGAHYSVSLPRPLITHRTRYNAQAMHQVLDSSNRYLYTCSGAVLIAFRVPVINMASSALLGRSTPTCTNEALGSPTR